MQEVQIFFMDFHRKLDFSVDAIEVVQEHTIVQILINGAKDDIIDVAAIE